MAIVLALYSTEFDTQSVAFRRSFCGTASCANAAGAAKSESPAESAAASINPCDFI